MSSANQTILWNTVNRIPAFIQLSPPKRDLEFKRITEYFYREHANKPNLSTAQLQELNRKTILAFLPSASALSREKPPLHPSTLSLSSRNSPSSSSTESNMVETRQEKQERAFLERQTMYAQMTEKPNLPSPDIFKEKEPDEKITNMDELIENYQKQRNLEIPVIPPIIPSSVSPVPSTTKRKITFLEETQINSLEIQDLSAESMSAEGASSEGNEKKNLASSENVEKKNLASNDGSDKKNLASNDMYERKNLASNDMYERKNLAWNINLEETRVIEDSYLQELEKRIASLEKQIRFLSEIRNERNVEIETQEKEVEVENENENENGSERKEIEEIIESVIISIEQQV